MQKFTGYRLSGEGLPEDGKAKGREWRRWDIYRRGSKE